MKKSTISILAILAIMVVSPPFAQSQDSVIDERFARVEKWLSKENLSVTRSVNQAFADNCVVVEGEGLPSPEAGTPGQKRLTAQRAAEIVAYRRLAEFLDGVAVVGDGATKEVALKYDAVRVAVSGFIKGAQVIYKEYNEKDEVALVLVKVGMTGPGSFGEVVYKEVLGDPNIGKDVLSATKPVDGLSPIPVDEAYDGLIVDATEQNFRPALINRIFISQDEVLYDPSKVSQKVLVEHGCGEYTNTVEKAREALGKRGVKNPLTVKATGVVSSSDLRISDDDAVKVFSANQKGNFLSEARVAFVLR